MNMLKIFPTAQFPVQEVVEYCKTDKRIERVIVFGSALETRHNPWSDIDLFVEGVDRKNLFISGRTFKRSLYIICLDMLDKDEELLKKIYKNGVVVYERDDV